LLVEGRWRDAANEYEALGMPYQQALALAQDETPEARAEAIALFERVGASAAAARLRASPTATARAPSGDGAAGERTLATLILTDLVDSTALLTRVGDRAWADLIDRHDLMVREELERHLGREIDSAGDGFLAAFDEPVHAIRCARAIVDRVGSLDLRVRVGIHTGEVERRGQRARGVAVHLVARVAACAAPGEVLVTGTTRDLVAGSGLAFTDRGKHELKGIERPRRLFALED
jgi:class 3 adenylate cyclase